MTAQEMQGAGRASAATPTARDEDRDRQQQIFEEREEELLARYHDKFIVVCGGEVFVGDDPDEVISRAQDAHQGRPYFLCMCHMPHRPARDNSKDPVDEAFEAETAKQKAIFMERIDELLAAYPEKYIVVCGGDVFVGDTDAEAISKANGAHPGRPFFMRMYDPCFVYRA